MSRTALHDRGPLGAVRIYTVVVVEVSLPSGVSHIGPIDGIETGSIFEALLLRLLCCSFSPEGLLRRFSWYDKNKVKCVALHF